MSFEKKSVIEGYKPNIKSLNWKETFDLGYNAGKDDCKSFVIQQIKEIKSKLANDLNYTFEMAWLDIEELLERLEK